MLLSSTPRPPLPLFLIIPIIILLAAYLYSVFTRPELNPQAKINNPGKYGWPEWFAKGVKTPYDSSNGSGEVCDERKSVLLFIDLSYDSVSIPYALEVLRTLKKDHNVDLAVISPFSPQWDKQSSIRENLEQAGCSDSIWRIGDSVRDLEGACPQSTLISEIVSPDQSGSSNPADAAIQVDPRANVTIVAQPHHLVSPHTSYEELAFKYGESWSMSLFSHALPSADPSIYYPSQSNLNRKAVTYFPHPHTPPSQYPRLPWGRNWTLYNAKYPPPPIRNVDDPFIETGAYSSHWRREESRLAEAMRGAGICVFEGWQDGVLDHRIVKALLSGCVVATVLPEVEHEVLLSNIIALPRPDDDAGHTPLPSETIHRILKTTTTSDLKQKALHGFILAHQKFLPTIRARAVFDAVKKWEQGGRGYLFPNGWRWTCDGAGETPPWCNA